MDGCGTKWGKGGGWRVKNKKGEGWMCNKMGDGGDVKREGGRRGGGKERKGGRMDV